MLRVKKWMTFACVLFASSLAADSIAVTVWCSNGRTVNELPIQVFDSIGTVVENATETDSNGQFQIENSETYVAPFRMRYALSNGSICGNYMIMIDPLHVNQGTVSLNYYPTNLPCSCSHLTNN